MMRAPRPEKSFYKIGEVAELVGVPAHVLRYWEAEFPTVKPMKTRGAHRMYRPKDVETLVLIRRLIHEQGFTVEGARKQIRALSRKSTGSASSRSSSVQASAKENGNDQATLSGHRVAGESVFGEQGIEDNAHVVMRQSSEEAARRLKLYRARELLRSLLFELDKDAESVEQGALATRPGERSSHDVQENSIPEQHISARQIEVQHVVPIPRVSGKHY